MSANENKKRKAVTIESFFKRMKSLKNEHDDSELVETVSVSNPSLLLRDCWPIKVL